jgi:hypothetical protein
MRKIIVKLFALDYICRAFGKTVNFVRAANIIFPLMCITGTITVLGGYAFESILGIVCLSLLLVSIFFGFVYFRLKPIKWEELDKSQKWQYGRGVLTQGDRLGISITPEQRKEWDTLDEEIQDIENKKFYNLKALLVNIVVIIVVFITIT